MCHVLSICCLVASTRSSFHEGIPPLFGLLRFEAVACCLLWAPLPFPDHIGPKFFSHLLHSLLGLLSCSAISSSFTLLLSLLFCYFLLTFLSVLLFSSSHFIPHRTEALRPSAPLVVSIRFAYHSERFPAPSSLSASLLVLLPHERVRVRADWFHSEISLRDHSLCHSISSMLHPIAAWPQIAQNQVWKKERRKTGEKEGRKKKGMEGRARSPRFGFVSTWSAVLVFAVFPSPLLSSMIIILFISLCLFSRELSCICITCSESIDPTVVSIFLCFHFLLPSSLSPLFCSALPHSSIRPPYLALSRSISALYQPSFASTSFFSLSLRKSSFLLFPPLLRYMILSCHLLSSAYSIDLTLLWAVQFRPWIRFPWPRPPSSVSQPEPLLLLPSIAYFPFHPIFLCMTGALHEDCQRSFGIDLIYHCSESTQRKLLAAGE